MNPAQTHVTLAYTIIAAGIVIKNGYLPIVGWFAQSPVGTAQPKTPTTGSDNTPPAIPPAGENG